MNREDVIRMAREIAEQYSRAKRFQTWAHHDYMMQRLMGLVDAAKAEEREACAKVCDYADKSTHPADLADAIRARGQA